MTDPTAPNSPPPEHTNSDPHESMNFVATTDDLRPYSSYVLLFAIDQCPGFGQVFGQVVGDKLCATTRPWQATIFDSLEAAQAAVDEHKAHSACDIAAVTNVAEFKLCHDSWYSDMFEHNQATHEEG